MAYRSGTHRNSWLVLPWHQMTMNRLTYTCLLAAVFMMACATLYTSTVTTTEIVDSAMKSWAALSVDGNSTPEIDAKVIAAHRRYQQAAVVARDALIAYKAGGDQTAYQKAFEAARVAMNALLDIILPLLQPAQQAELQAKTGRATKL